MGGTGVLRGVGFRSGRAFLTSGNSQKGSPLCLRMPVLAELPDVDSVASNAAAEVLVIGGADAELLDLAYFRPADAELLDLVYFRPVDMPMLNASISQVSSRQ